MSVASKISKRAKVRLAQLVRGESGQGPLITILVLLILGALIVAPLLTFMVTGLRSGQSLESRMQEYYAADAAVVDARWRIQNGELPQWMMGVWNESVYSHAPAAYTISGGVNGKDTTYTIQPIWCLEDLQSPADGINGRTPPDFDEEEPWYLELAMATDILGQGNAKISIICKSDLTVDRIGIWLPPGFSYVSGSSTFEKADRYAPPEENLYCVPTTSTYKGGTAIIWDTWNYADTAPNIPLSRLPEAGGTWVVNFKFTPGDQSPMGMFSWMRASNASYTYLCWDVDAKFYKIESEATTVDTGKYTSVEAYTVKNEFRKFGSAIEGDYVAAGNTLMRDTNHDSHGIRDVLDSSSDATVSTIPQDAQVVLAYLYWSAWESESSKQTLFSDSCSNFNNWYALDNWGHTWTVGQLSNANFRVRLTCNSTDGTRDFYLDWVPVRVYYSGGDTGWVSPTANAADTGGDNNGFEVSPTNAYADDSNYARNMDGAGDRHRYYNYNLNIPAGATIIGIQVRLDWWLDSTSGTNSMSVELSWDGGTSWTAAKQDSTESTSQHRFVLGGDDSLYDGGDSAWSYEYYSGRFTGYAYGKTNPGRYLTLKSSLNLSSYAYGTVVVSWNQYESGTLESDDGLDFAFSADGGITWSSNIQAFRDDNPASSFSYTIPAQYLTNQFKMRFYLNSFSDSGEYCYVDNINIMAMLPDTSVIFKIDGQQVYFDANGQPQKGSQQITASEAQVLPNYGSDGSSNGFSYSCFKDVTALVLAFSQKAPDPATNYPGNGRYTVSGVTGNTGDEWSYAGWSLIIVYSSSQTRGHQLYLYDKFVYSGMDCNVDFDGDGDPGGTISGFLAPDDIIKEGYAARLTCFVGEGDACYSGDSIKFNGAYLSDSKNPWNNVWNSSSIGLAADGIDIDTFTVAYPIIQPGDTSAHVDLPTQTDSWNLVYMVLSFRSLTTTGGFVTYLYGVG
jgi:hypothetical protein